MPKLKYWIKGKHLLERWNIDFNELIEFIEQGLPAYDDDLNRVEMELVENCYLGKIERYKFEPSDIEQFEADNEWLLKGKTTLPSELTGDERRELGQLRTEKKKWDASINASVKIGLFVSEQTGPLKRDDVKNELYKIDSSLPDTTFEMIWKAIPDQYRHKGGRPKKG